MLKRLQKRKGQVTVETAVLFGTVVAGLIALAVYLQRAVQGGVKSNADSFGTQFAANTNWSVITDSNSTEVAGNIVLTNQFTNFQQNVR